MAAKAVNRQYGLTTDTRLTRQALNNRHTLSFFTSSSLYTQTVSAHIHFTNTAVVY